MNDLATFFIDKTTQTFADTLTAFGWASVLLELHYRQKTRADITIQDKGPYYCVTCAPLLPQTLEGLRSTMVWPGKAVVIQTPKNAGGLPEGVLHRIDYEAERDRVNAFYAARNKAGDGQNAPDAPHPHWDIFRAINPMSLPGYNGLLLNWWATRDAQPEIFSILFALFGQMPNDLDAAIDAWKQLDKTYGWGIKPFTTCQQLYNPDQGKGQNRPKANSLAMSNLDGFWLIEWLKLVGFYEAAITRQVRGAKDRKTFVVAPRSLTFADHSSVMGRFANTMRYSETSTKFDILAAVRYLKELLTYSLEPEGQGLMARLGRVKQEVVGGFYTAFYKDLGNAAAVMNVAFIALPGWIIVNSEQEARLYKELLDELDAVTRQFDESHSDAFDLLQHLRDFVSGDDLTAFFRFTNAFPAYLIGRREQGKYAHSFSTTFVERLIMNIERRFSDILTNPGFQNIAYAIRQSTVTAQYRKKQGDRKYDVRYGLGQELARKARYPETFIAMLSDFLHKYNAENAQVMETRSGPYRRSIQTSDIDEVVRLIDEYGSETVANLLIAYGYARVPREGETDEPETEYTNQENEQ